MLTLLLACTGDPEDTGPFDTKLGDTQDSAVEDPCYLAPEPTPLDPASDCPTGESGLFAVEDGAYWISQPIAGDEHTELILFLGGGGAEEQSVRGNLQGLLQGDERFLDYRIVAPWVGDSDREASAMAAVQAVQDCFGGDLSRVHLIGHSSGGRVAYSLALEQRFSTVVGFPAMFDSGVSDDDLIEGLECEPVLNAAGSEDSWLGEVQATHERLEGLGLDSTLLVVEGEGHVPGPDFDPGPFYDWLDAH